MSEAAAPRLDGTLARIDSLLPPASAFAFALRIWIAMMLALCAAFWLQLSGASSAAVCVAILAQPRRGQALSKAVYRFLGTLVGAVVAVAMIGLFAQDRVLLLVSFACWLSLCVYAAHFLQDTRAYGAMLSGYTVAIIAIAHIDAPQATFEAAIDRVAAIVLGIVAVTLINDALGAPRVSTSLRTSLAEVRDAAMDFVSETLTKADPGAERTSALIRRIAALRSDAGAVRSESGDGANRSAGARSVIAALYEMIAAARTFREAQGRLEMTNPSVAEARELCLRLTEAGSGDAPGTVADRIDALVDTAVAEGEDLGILLALQRARDVSEAMIHVRGGWRAFETGCRPLRDVPLPTHRDVPVALRGAARVALAFGLTALFFVSTGWPGTSFALVQVAAQGALSSIAPNPKAFARGVMIGMPLAALCAGFVLFVMLSGVQGFPLLALAMAPVVFCACLLSLNPATFPVGFILLVFFPVLLSPSNPQSYDPEAFLGNAFLVVVAAAILAATVRVILPVTPAQHRAIALDSARRSLAAALAGEGGDATTRTSLNSDRLLQFAQWSSGSGAVRAMALDHAFALSRLEAAAARAHGQLRLIAHDPGLSHLAERSGRAIVEADSGAMTAAAGGLVAAGGEADAITRERIVRAASDLLAVAALLRGYARFLRRLGIADVS